MKLKKEVLGILLCLIGGLLLFLCPPFSLPWWPALCCVGLGGCWLLTGERTRLRSVKKDEDESGKW